MGITNFYTRLVDTQRMTAVGGGSKRQDWQNNLSGIPCAIIPENGNLVTIQNSAFYNLFKLYCSNSYDIAIGDRIIDENDVVYSVTGKATFDGLSGSSNSHTKYNIVKGK